VPVEVTATRRAQQQIAALDRTHTRAFATFLDDLSLNGCAALAYRLTGPVPLSRLCVKHLRAAAGGNSHPPAIGMPPGPTGRVLFA
jgi:hypothetical protein